MSTRVNARAGNDTYEIVVGNGLQNEIIAAVKDVNVANVVIISDTTVGPKWGGEIVELLRTAGTAARSLNFPAGESNKNQENVTIIQDALLKDRLGRDTLILALGGGVVGDVAGYVASTFLRGVPYIQVPTTILAMVDSSIGGKVGIDTPHGKNTIGAFWQPRAVISDIAFLKSLPQREVISGILEAVKCFISADKDALGLVDTLSIEDPLSTADVLEQIILRAASFKAGVVERDEREENERRILNFGHTVGHAIELLSGYKMPHGFAVGYGMLVETKVAEDLAVLSAHERAKVVEYLKRLGIEAKALEAYDIEKVLEAMKGDKKVRGGKVYMVLLNAVGSVSTENGQFAHPVEEDVIRKAYERAARGA